MNVSQSVVKITKTVWIQVVVLVCVLMHPQSQPVAAQTASPAQSPFSKNTAIPLPVTPKWMETVTVELVFKAADMATILDKIHEQTGITIIREGSPVKSVADISFHGPLKAALDQIADTFDYIWVPSKKLSKALLMNKRFRSQEEHPEWHEKEMLHVSEQVCRALQSPLAVSEPYGNVRDLLHLLYHELSAEQLQSLYKGGKLTFQDLSAGQSLLLNQQIYSVALGGVNDSWIRLQSRLAHLKDAKLILKPAGTYKTLNIVFPPGADGTPDSVILRYYVAADLEADTVTASVPVKQERTTPLNVQASAQADEEQTTLQRRIDIRMQGGRLADLLQEISQHSRCKTTMADYLQEQHLSLWTKGCSIRSLMDLLAEQNEWEWTYTPLTGLNITRHDTYVPANLAEVSAAFQLAMPPGYRHYLGLGISPDDWLKDDEDPQIKFNRRIPGGDVMSMRRRSNRKASSNNPDDPIMLLIWPTQPQKFSNRAELSYKEWTSQTKEAVLWSLMAVAMRGFFGSGRGFDVVAGRLTPYESNPDLVRLQLDGLADGQYHVFGYSFAAFDPKGGETNSLAFAWTLKNAADPLSPYLLEISKRY
ncbi:MAG: hypothetical protein JWN14_1789 [Chthonomonadales bacterium]|nr:hypothetical protein [Chthonomonadales bacterium]